MDDDFHSFAETRLSSLRRTGYLLSGDWHTADDLTSITLTKVFLAWKRLARRGELDGYVRKVMLRAYLDMRRRSSFGEVPVEEFPADAGERPDPADDRLVLLQALDRLTAPQRAVVVLRYWEDLDVASVATALDMPASTVRSHASRGLESLRTLLADTGITVMEGI